MRCLLLLLVVLAILLGDVAQARSRSQAWVERNGLVSGDVLEVRFEEFDEVISLDPEVLQVEVLDSFTIRLSAGPPGAAALLFRRGGMTDALQIEVADLVRGSGDVGSENSDAEMWIGGDLGAVVGSGAPTGRASLAAGFRAVNPQGHGAWGSFDFLHANNPRLRLARIGVDQQRYRLTLGDHSLRLGDPTAPFLVRGVSIQGDAIQGKLTARVGGSLGFTLPSIGLLFESGGDLVTTAHGELEVGSSVTRVEAGFVLATDELAFHPLVGVSQSLSLQGFSLEASGYRVGDGFRFSGAVSGRTKWLSHSTRIAASTRDAYDGYYARTVAESFNAQSMSVVSLGSKTRAGIDLRGFSRAAGGFESLFLGGEALWTYFHDRSTIDLRGGFSRNVSNTTQSRVSLAARAAYRAPKLFLDLRGRGFYSVETASVFGRLDGSWLSRVNEVVETGPSFLIGYSRSPFFSGGWSTRFRHRKSSGRIDVMGTYIDAETLRGTLRATGNLAVTRGLEVSGSVTGTIGSKTRVLSANIGFRARRRFLGVGGESIRGRLYEDVDLDGEFYAGDLPVEKVEISIGGKRAITNAAGRYRITGLPPTEYLVVVDVPGYRNLDGEVLVATQRGRSTEQDIALTRVQRVDVRVFSDTDGDGTHDPDERLVAVEKIELVSSEGEPDVRPAPRGVANFVGEWDGELEARYSVLYLAENYLPVGPTRKTFEMNGAGRQVVSFPVRPDHLLSGRLCEDTNENGRFDGADSCTAGRTLRLSDGREWTTSEGGKFAISTLEPGSWTLSCDRCDPYGFLVNDRVFRSTGLMLLATKAAVVEVDSPEVEGEVVALRLRVDDATLKYGESTGFSVLATLDDFSQRTESKAELVFQPPGVLRRTGGRLIGLRRGETQVSAVVGNQVSPPITVRVRSVPVVGLTATPARFEMDAGALQALDMRVIYVDGDVAEVSEPFDWISDRPDVARVEGNGVVVGVAPGVALIRGSVGGVSTNPVQVRVRPGASVGEVSLNPGSLVLGLESRGRMYVDAKLTTGRTVQLASDVQWFSDDPGVVEVQHGGRLQPRSIGRTTLYARYNGLQTPRAQVEVVPAVGLIAQPTFGAIPVGGTTVLEAIEVLSDGTFRNQGRAKWRSADPTIASVQGATLTAHAAGQTEVVAMHRGQESLPLAVDVVASNVVELRLSPEVLEVAAEEPGFVDAMAAFANGRNAVVSNASQWVVADPEVAKVDNEGVVTGLRPGRTLIMATWMGVESEPIPVVVGTAIATVADAVLVEPAAVAMSAQGQQELAVSVLSESGHVLRSKAVRWEVADPSVAWVEQGVVKAIAVGSTTITAIHGDVRSIPVPVTVHPIVGVNAAPALGRLPVGARVDLKAVGIVDDGSLEDLSRSGTVRWSSSDPQVIQINEDGTLLAFKAGRSTLRANWRNLQTLPMTVEVADVDITGLAIDPDRASLRVDETLPLAAVAVFGDGQVADATPHVSWTTTRPEVASVDDGLLKGHSPGVAEVFATWMDVESEKVRVTIAVADAVGVILGNASAVMLAEARLPLRATAITTDGKLLDASQQTTWHISDTSIVRVDANGYLEARGPGEAVLFGEVGGHKSPPVQVEVTTAALLRLQVEPGALAVAPDDPVEMKVFAELVDGRRIEVSPQILWEIEGKGVAVDRYNRLLVGSGAKARVRARYDEVRSPWAQIVATE